MVGITMNDTILRGFCQKCFVPCRFDNFKTKMHNTKRAEYHQANPVWFLSPKQMRVVESSDKFWEWINQEIAIQQGFGDITWLSLFIDREPFLVAKILSDAGKDS